MATVQSTAFTGFINGSSQSNNWIGYSGSNLRVVRWTFTVPSEGATGISFKFNTTGGDGGNNRTNLRWYVGTDPNSHASASGTNVAYTGTFDASWSSSGLRYTFTSKQVNSLKLKAGTYYLFVFPAHSTSGNYVTLTSGGGVSYSPLTITTSGSYKPHTLTFSIGAGTTLTVKKGSTTLSSGATVYTGDTIAVTYSAQTGYKDPTCSVSGVGSIASGGTFEVASDHTITTSATLLEFLLSISKDANSTLSVTRGGSELADGTTLYYGDALTVVYGAPAGYKIETATLNGAAIASGANHTVTSNVAIVIVAKAQGQVEIGDGESFAQYAVYIGNGTTFELYIPYIGNGESWDLY